MEEASLDHGLDRLPFFFLLLLALTPRAYATSFGPINVVEQAKQSNYFVHGQIASAGWTEVEPRLRRPYTYWKLRVIDQPAGNPLPGEITIRSPGGEVGDLGYQVAGAATFAPQEEVFVSLRDTDDRDAKEVVGLASGKYLVQNAEGGRKQVVSGLGFVVRGERGLLSPEEFGRLLQRSSQGKETEADRKVSVNNTAVHDEETPLDAAARRAEAISREYLRSRAAGETAHTPVASHTDSATEIVQRGPQPTEEPSKGSSVGIVILAGGALAALFIALLVFLRR